MEHIYCTTSKQPTAGVPRKCHAERISVLTGNRDTDRLILQELDDKSFVALCSVSTYTCSLCDEILWADRFALKYGGTLWQYGLSHRDVYIEFSKLKGEALLKRVVDKRFINILEKMIKNLKKVTLGKILHHSSIYGYLEVVKLMLKNNTGSRTDINQSLLAAAENGHLEVVRLLLDEGADIHTGVDFALRLACIYNKLEVVKILLDRGADIHARGDYALRTASVYGHLEVIELLLDRGADIHIKEDYALRWTSQHGHLEVVKLLLDRGADIHAKDNNALRWASQYGRLEIVQLLLDKGADIHADNDSALRLASQYNHLEVVKLLVNRDADTMRSALHFRGTSAVG